MACKQDSGNFDFFNDIENYIEKEKEIQSDEELSQPSENCKSISQYLYKLKNPERVNGICENFTKLYKSLANFNGERITKNINDSDWGFLNYWLNYKFKEIKINENICIKNFYDSIETYFNDIFQDGFAMGKMYDIKNDDFNNIKALYFLYNKYITLHNILSKPLKEEEKVELDTRNDCYVDYIKARASCIRNENKYCEKLKDFKSKYEALFSLQEGKNQEFNNNFKKLPDDSDVLELLNTILFEENFHSIITIPIILSIFGMILLLFIFYKVKRN
ncbi:hypothetical protein PVMG_06069 [Plasmodium vivax Mauritania I]|uniref:PIR Superfamily Protein n=1 Tax=Plasmodium vivax Mauritania I TaxID=1035515 RepID=A0A0J9T4P6_PLAVI|nr:hypothetical protein PVMG_06069 [Plasmodium vivax Mauritania I]